MPIDGHSLRRYLVAMSQIINLRTARKQMARAKKREDAAAQSAQHGRSKAEKRLQEARAAQLRAHLDAHKREP